MEAKHILRQVEGCIFDLLNSGETEVVFGERLGESFNVYVKDGNTVEVSYGGNSVKVSLPSAINSIKESLLARYIMQGFARIYLNKNESKNMNRKIRITETTLHKIVKESVKQILREGYETWWGVWSQETWNQYGSDEIKHVFLLVKAATKEDAEGIAEDRLISKHWMTDPVAHAHPATKEDFDRWKRQDIIEFEKIKEV